MRFVFLSILLDSSGIRRRLRRFRHNGSSTTTTSTVRRAGSGNGSADRLERLQCSRDYCQRRPAGRDGYVYQNAAFASATICAPGSTSNCVTIDNLLVDTGSTGLRVFASEVASLDLPAVNASNGSAAYDCVAFVDGSYLWGPVEQADVTLGGETASKCSHSRDQQLSQRYSIQLLQRRH